MVDLYKKARRSRWQSHFKKSPTQSYKNRTLSGRGSAANTLIGKAERESVNKSRDSALCLLQFDSLLQSEARNELNLAAATAQTGFPTK